jgi:hypothetical protein
MNTAAPIFVVGHPRSGTTLVQQILSAHSEIWSGPETYVFAKLKRHGDKLKPSDLSPLMKRWKKLDGNVVPEATRVMLLQQAQVSQLNVQSLVLSVMNALKPEGSTASHWLEKTPEHVFYLPEIWETFPDARVINVVRDPRAVASSPKAFGRAPSDLRRLMVLNRYAERWLTAIDAYETHRNDERIVSVRYEDLVANPEQELQRMAAHIGIMPDMSALQRFSEQYDRITMNKSAKHKALNRSERLVDRREVWRERLTVREIRLIETICGQAMKRYNYVPENAPDRALATRIKWIRSLRRFRNRMAKNWRRITRRVQRFTAAK